MKPAVPLAGCAELPESDGDDTPLPAVLGELGVTSAWAPWDDRPADFAAADLVILRTTWDYPQRYAEFLKLVLELEPSLGFRQADGGARLRFASTIRAALARR